MIYNILVILVILISLQLNSWLMKREYTFKSIYLYFLFFLKDDFNKIFKSDTREVLSFLKLIRLMSFYASVILFFIMASSGFLPFAFIGTGLTGFALVIHVTAAPLFCLSYAILIVLSAFQYKFEDDDYMYIFKRNILGKSVKIEPVKSFFILKTMFWISAAISIPVIASIILSLYPIFGTSGMGILITVHKYSVLIFTISFVIQVYYSIILRVQAKNNT
jgi:hypothetical protein